MLDIPHYLILTAYDAVFTDEVVVHLNNLDGFFAKCRKILKPGGRMVNKELHFTHSSYTQWSDRLSQHINKVFGYTGNYRTLLEELQLMDKNSFRLTDLYDLPIADYRKTIDEGWLKNMHENRERLEHVTSPEHYADFRKYLKAIMFTFRGDYMRLHIVASQKM